MSQFDKSLLCVCVCVDVSESTMSVTRGMVGSQSTTQHWYSLSSLPLCSSYSSSVSSITVIISDVDVIFCLASVFLFVFLSVRLLATCMQKLLVGPSYTTDESVDKERLVTVCKSSNSDPVNGIF